MLFLVYWLLGGTVGPSKCRNKCIGSRVAVHFQTISISYGQIFPGPKEATQRIFPDIALSMQWKSSMWIVSSKLGFLFPSSILVHFVRDQADGQEDGRFLVAPQRYDRLVKEGRDTGQLNLVRVHEHFRVAGQMVWEKGTQVASARLMNMIFDGVLPKHQGLTHAPWKNQG